MEDLGRGTAYRDQDGRLHIEPWDDYEHPSKDVQYVMENILQTTGTCSKNFQSLRDTFNFSLLACCDCLEENENIGNVCSGSNCNHGSNYTLYQSEENIELVLDKKRKSTDVLYECSSSCLCPVYCYNRLVQFGPRKYLKIIDCSTDGKGLGLNSTKRIPEGGFICEYAGEILSEEETFVRHQSNDVLNQMNYIIRLNECSSSTKMESKDEYMHTTYIDAGRISNIGRYLNHSCDPNCELISVRVDCLIPKICNDFFFEFGIHL